jgi:hypothetical protein
MTNGVGHALRDGFLRPSVRRQSIGSRRSGWSAAAGLVRTVKQHRPKASIGLGPQRQLAGKRLRVPR